MQFLRFLRKKNRCAAQIDRLPYTLNLPATFADMREVSSLELSAENVRARFLAARAELPEEVTVLDKIRPASFPQAKKKTVYVSASGKPDAAGTKAEPLSDLQAAVDAVKGGGTVRIGAGVYTFPSSVRIGAEHSGTPECPLILQADGKAVFTSDKQLSGAFHPIDPVSDAVAARIPAAVQDKIVYTTLEEQGLTESDMAEISRKYGPPHLRVGKEEYTLAHYPTNTQDIHQRLYFTVALDSGRVRTRDGSDLYWPWVERAKRDFGGDIDREVGWQVRVINSVDNAADPHAEEMANEILSWVNTGNIWYFGSTFEGWEFGYYNLADEADGLQNWHYGPKGEKLLGGFTPDENGPVYTLYDAEGNAREEKGFFFLKSKHANTWGCKHSTNSPSGHNSFYLFNVVEALQAPGEWFYDKDTGRIYIYPTESFGKTDIFYSGSANYDLFTLENASNVIFDGICITGSGACGIKADKCESVIVENAKMSCTVFPSVCYEECTHSAVLYSDFSNAYTDVMVRLHGEADCKKLIPSDNLVQNCVFHNSSPNRAFAVTMGGCRTVISHNYFNNCVMNGDFTIESIVEYNRFDGGSKDVVDGGMVYCSGPASRGNHYRFNLCHRFNATHNAFYNDTMNSGNYTYSNLVSTINSKSNSNKGWYSSTGTGNVCYGNIFALRNPVQVAAANGRDGDEGETMRNNIGDQVNQSGLFYYFWDNNGYKPREGNPPYEVVDYDGNPVGASFRQSLAGHWWRGFRQSELKSYTEERDAEAYRRRFPVYMNHLEDLRFVFEAQDHSDYHIKYFYAPMKLTGKSYTCDKLYPGCVLTIPPYTYLDENGQPVEVPQHTVEAPDGKATLTYEEIGAIERGFRAPNCCVIERNLILGGTPIVKENGEFEEKNCEERTITDDAKRWGYLGYADTAKREKNYLHFRYADVFDADRCKYDIAASTWEKIDAEMGLGYRDNFEKIDPAKAGVTTPINYADFD